MKNLFRKNNIIIAALAIMILIAGYLNFTSKSDKSMNLSDTNDYDTTESTMGDDISDSDLLSLDDQGNLIDQSALDVTDSDSEVAQSDTNDTAVDDAAANDTATEDTAAADSKDGKDTASKDDADLAAADSSEVQIADSDTDEETSTPGEAVLVSTTTAADFFASKKMEREQIRSDNYEKYMEIINTESLSEESKQIAVNAMVKQGNVKSAETAAEMLLEAKGFSDALVFMQDKRVDVVVNAEKITEQDLAQIMDIVKGETGMKTSQIHVAPTIANE